MRQRRSNGYLQDTDRQEEEEMKYITFDEDKPYDLILLGRVAIDFNPLDYNKPLYESETFKKYVGGFSRKYCGWNGETREKNRIFCKGIRRTSSAHLWSVILRMKG